MNNTLVNGFRVLEYLAASGRDCSVKEIAGQFKLPNSHACRLLKTLADTGYVIQTPGSRKYRIGLKILNLSCVKLASLELRNKARRNLRMLADHLGVIVYLTQVERGISIIIDTEIPDNAFSPFPYVIGRMHPVNRSASGKLCAAYAEPELLRELLKQCDYRKTASRSITGEAAFLRELRRIRRQGYSVLESETREGIFAASAPIFASGELIGTVGAMLSESPEPPAPERMRDLIRSLVDCGKKLSEYAEDAPGQAHPA